MNARRLSAAAAMILGSLLGPNARGYALEMIPPIDEPSAPATAPLGRVVRLAWFDPADSVPGVFSSVRHETTDLMQRMGVSVQWRRAHTRELARMDEVSVIFVAHGGTGSRPRQAVVMGACPLDSRPHRAVWVHAPRVLAALGLSPRRQGLRLSPHDEAQFTRALARVIVHEVVHAVAPDVPHGGGLMSGRLSRKQLTGDVVEVDASVTLALRQALSGPAPHEPARPAESATATAAAAESTEKATSEPDRDPGRGSTM